MRETSCTFLGFAIACMHCGSVAADTNLFPNGDFSSASQITGWTILIDANTGALSWNSDDAGADTNSGSIELDTDSGGDFTTATSLCFAVPTGGAYSVGGLSKVVVINGISDFSFEYSIDCSIYSTPACSSDGLEVSVSPVTFNSMTWTSMTPVNGTLPNDAKSANCQISVVNPYNAELASVRFDNLFFTADYIFSNGFE